jgi:type II secretory pathway component PulK
MTEDVADAIIDWRDSDDVPSNTGVESGYYENLPFGYRIRNGPFRTIRELLLVKGVTEELFYGEGTQRISNIEHRMSNDEVERGGWIEYLTCYSVDSDKDASGNSRININNANQNELESSLGIKSAQARWIVNNRGNRRYESIADLISQNSPREASGTTRNDPNATEPLDIQTFYQIADKITTSSGGNVQGRVNINTASDVVLTALLGGGDEAEQIAVGIVNYRNNLAAGMQSIAEVLQAGLMNIDAFKRVANYLTTRSDVFTVRCFATADRSGAIMQTEAVVDRSTNPCEVLYWYEGVSN